MKKVISLAIAAILGMFVANAQESISLKEAKTRHLLPKAEIKRLEQLHEKALIGLKGSVAPLAGLNFDPSNSFTTAGTNNLDFFLGYIGSTSAFDQGIIQMSNPASSSDDSTKVDYVPASGSGQISFAFVNLISGKSYNYRYGLFDATNGILTFYPSASGSFQVSTVFAAQSSLNSTSYLNCTAKTVDIGPLSSNDPNTWIKVLVDTGMNPTFASAYSLTYTMPQFNIGAIGNLLSYSIDVSSLINYYPHNASAPELYAVKVTMTNSALWTASTTASCGLLAGENEISDEKKSIMVFPNPNPTTVKTSVECTMQTYDVTGRIISSEKISAGQTLLSSKNLSPGIYFLRFFNDNGESLVTDKIIFTK